MSHDAADCWEEVHHFLYHRLRGKVSEDQYVGTVKMSEEEIEEAVFHPADVNYNWLAYWKKHPDGRSAEGSWKLRHPEHGAYTDTGMQVHITLFHSTVNDDWLDVYAHYEYDNVKRPILHLREVNLSADEGVNRARTFLLDHGVQLYDLH